MCTDWKTYLFLALFTLATAGGSILYLSEVAKESDNPATATFPVLTGTMSEEYATLSINMVESHIFSRSTTTPLVPDSWRTPGYPAFMAPFYVLFGNFYLVLIAQIVLLFATVLMLFWMTRSLLGYYPAIIVSTIYLLLPDTLLSVASLLSENLFVFCFVAALYLCFFSPWRQRYLSWGVAGLLLALSAYVRPASLYIVPFFLFGYYALYLDWRAITWRQILSGALLVVVFVATLLPWAYRNQEVFGHFSFASTGAFVIFRQNAVQFYEARTDTPNLESRYILLERAGLPPGPVPQGFEHSEALMRVAKEVITEHPLQYTFFHLTTFIPFFTSSGAQNYWFFVQTMRPAFNPEPEPSFIQAIHPFSLPLLIEVLQNHGWTLLENALWALIALLVLIGLIWSKDVRLARMFFMLILYFALVTGPIAHARYRIPAEPLLLIAAASTLAYLYERRSSGG